MPVACRRTIGMMMASVMNVMMAGIVNMTMDGVKPRNECNDGGRTVLNCMMIWRASR
jgi:hypothetical protein